MDAILEQFLSEARENLSYLDENLKDIQNTDEEGVNALFRAAHTLKGGAGLVEFNAVKEITHAAEDLLDAYRQNKIDYSDGLVDVLYDAFDEVIELIDAGEEIGSVNIDIDEEKLQRYELSKDTLLQYTSLAIGGMKVGTMYKGLERYPISLRLEGDERRGIEAIKNIQINSKRLDC